MGEPDIFPTRYPQQLCIHSGNTYSALTGCLTLCFVLEMCSLLWSLNNPRLFGSFGWTTLWGRDYCSPGFTVGETEDQRARRVAGGKVLNPTLCCPPHPGCEEWRSSERSVPNPVCSHGVLSWTGVREDTRRPVLPPAPFTWVWALSFTWKSHRKHSGSVVSQTNWCVPCTSRWQWGWYLEAWVVGDKDSGKVWNVVRWRQRRKAMCV